MSNLDVVPNHLDAYIVPSSDAHYVSEIELITITVVACYELLNASLLFRSLSRVSILQTVIIVELS